MRQTRVKVRLVQGHAERIRFLVNNIKARLVIRRDFIFLPWLKNHIELVAHQGRLSLRTEFHCRSLTDLCRMVPERLH